MSLRADITSAYDEIAPPAPQLQAQIRMSVSAEARAASQSRRTRGPWMASLRGTMALVGALLVVRLILHWSFFNIRPAPPGQPSELAQLESRPLHLPDMKAGDACPADAPRVSIYGSGPAYGGAPLASYYSHKTSWGDYWDIELVVDAGVKGLVLVRARDLRTNQPVIFVGAYAGGPGIGSDTVDGKVVRQHLELVLDTSHPQLDEAGLQLMWSFTAGLANGYSACTGWQIDGQGFTETYAASGE